MTLPSQLSMLATVSIKDSRAAVWMDIGFQYRDHTALGPSGTEVVAVLCPSRATLGYLPRIPEFVYVYVYLCVYVHVDVAFCLCICTHTYIYNHIYMCICTYTCSYTNEYICIYVYTDIKTCIHVCTCMCTYFMCIHTIYQIEYTQLLQSD